MKKKIQGKDLASSVNPDKPPNTQHCEQHFYYGGLTIMFHILFCVPKFIYKLAYMLFSDDITHHQNFPPSKVEDIHTATS